jgi:hypothetical protein
MQCVREECPRALHPHSPHVEHHLPAVHGAEGTGSTRSPHLVGARSPSTMKGCTSYEP